MSLAKALLRGPKDDRRWFLACLSLGPIATFTLVAATANRVLPHWAAPGYLLIFPLLGADIEAAFARARRRVVVWFGATTVSLALVLAAVISLSLLPWPPLAWPGAKTPPDPLAEARSWAELKRELGDRGFLDRPRLFVAATRWHEAARIDYALAGKVPVVCLSSDPRGYGILRPAKEHLGEDALIIAHDLAPDRVMASYARYFDRIEPLDGVSLKRQGKTLVDFALYYAQGLHEAAQPPDLIDPLGYAR
jgi:hypothetical protein